MIRKQLASLTLLFAMTSVQAAYAGDPALAESLFRQGRTLMEKRDYSAACPKLAESYAQEPTTGTLLALALCQEQLGQTASAWANFLEVASRSKREGREDREKASRARAAALEPKLSYLTIEVDPAVSSVPGLEVKRDGAEIGAAAWGAPAPVDPGRHVVEATAPGKQPFKTIQNVGATADKQVVRITELLAAPEQSAAPVPAPAVPEKASKPTTELSSGTGSSTVTQDVAVENQPPLRTIGFGLCGASAIALGVGGFFAIRAMDLNSESKEAGRCDPNNLCNQDGFDLRENSRTAARNATIAFVAGGALAAAGVTLVIVGRPKSSSNQALSIDAAPVVAPRQAAMLMRARF